MRQIFATLDTRYEYIIGPPLLSFPRTKRTIAYSRHRERCQICRLFSIGAPLVKEKSHRRDKCRLNTRGDSVTGVENRFSFPSPVHPQIDGRKVDGRFISGTVPRLRWEFLMAEEES